MLAFVSLVPGLLFNTVHLVCIATHPFLFSVKMRQTVKYLSTAHILLRTQEINACKTLLARGNSRDFYLVNCSEHTDQN